MGWLTKIFKGSGHKILQGQYHGKYQEDTIWEGPSTSVVIIADLSMLFGINWAG